MCFVIFVIFERSAHASRKVKGRVAIVTANNAHVLRIRGAMSVPVQAAPAGIDDPLAASQADHNVSEARRRRHRSTRRAGSATIRSEQPSSREVPREQQVEEGGEEEEASSVYSSSTVSASARCQLSFRVSHSKSA